MKNIRYFIIRNDDGWHIWDRETDVKVLCSSMDDAINKVTKKMMSQKTII